MASIFDALGSRPTMDIIQRFQQFRQMFSGDPKQIQQQVQQRIQQMIDSGRISQAQYDQAVQQANETYKKMMK